MSRKSLARQLLIVDAAGELQPRFCRECGRPHGQCDQQHHNSAHLEHMLMLGKASVDPELGFIQLEFCQNCAAPSRDKCICDFGLVGDLSIREREIAESIRASYGAPVAVNAQRALVSRLGGSFGESAMEDAEFNMQALVAWLGAFYDVEATDVQFIQSGVLYCLGFLFIPWVAQGYHSQASTIVEVSTSRVFSVHFRLELQDILWAIAHGIHLDESIVINVTKIHHVEASQRLLGESVGVGEVEVVPWLMTRALKEARVFDHFEFSLPGEVA